MPLVLQGILSHAMGLHLGLGWCAVDIKIPRRVVQIFASSISSGLAGLAKHFGFGAGALSVCCRAALACSRALPCRANRQTDVYAKI
jgi:hypothetical protein